MFRFSVNELSTIKWSFEEDVIHYHEAGFAALGIWYPKLIEYGQEKAAELLNEYGFWISSVSFRAELTGGQGMSYRQGLLQALDVIQAAADLGAKTVIMMLGGRNGHTRNHSLRILGAALEVLAEASQAVGVHLAIEPTHAGCSNDSYLNTIPQCMDLIAKVDNPHLGIVFDSYHLTQDSSALTMLDWFVRYIRVVQLGDAKYFPMGRQNRCPLGHGRLPLLELLQAFQQYSYEGYYEIELLGAGVEHMDYRQLLGHSRHTTSLWQKQSSLQTNSFQNSLQGRSK